MTLALPIPSHTLLSRARDLLDGRAALDGLGDTDRALVVAIAAGMACGEAGMAVEDVRNAMALGERNAGNLAQWFKAGA